ncbi:FAD binding domain-containing protein [Allosediminivita pacifica]|uniref:Xanthine dehydrogenase YagS FAD-binding subunit n=1 Tax=Allosediminivita pacifica TaxID=1267769 RepID=A0A2T6A6C5_9RHOB|nr:xanthine dehydrogenase family protein subunit M [Allosediminivita pacifica]PTX39374.1 xanthine dehydrogenase YagS FAD-binding subunit [Allosediminivita pacifica]GGB27906.1 FAD-binding molybdopterin dehydrogenase [Allosediminivita pacifica]
MKRFEFIQPSSVEEALAAWEPGAAWLGGGTNLLDLMKIGAMQPDRVIDITRLPGLSGIETLSDGSIRIGALVRNSDLAVNATVARDLPMVAEALLSGASGQLRNAATVGGNLMQHTRCNYFQDPHAACNRREPGAGCDAREAGDRMALLGWSDGCIATNPSDFCVPLAALDAVIEVRGPQGAREIHVSEFHLLPGDNPQRVTALEPGELILALRLPPEATAFAGHARYLKVRDRTSFAFAMSSAAAALKMEDGRISDARLALGAVAAKPWRAAEAEAMLSGAAPEEALFTRAADAALAEAKPSGDNAWKIDLARRTAVRALLMAAAGTPARIPALPASPFGSKVGDLAHA